MIGLRQLDVDSNRTNVRAPAKSSAAHIQKFIDRFRYKATKAKQAQSRVKMLERMEPIAEVLDGPPVTFDFPDPQPPLAPPLFSIRDAAVGYEGVPILKNLSLRLDEDDRVALIGANGNGKSTLMRLLAGRLHTMSGTMTKSPKLRIGYFAQHQTDELDIGVTPVVELSRRRPDDTNEQIEAARSFRI